MDIIYLGHSSFKIKGKNMSVVTDPFDPKKVGLKFPKTEAEVVTISHHHDDHDAYSQVDGVKRVVDGPGEYEIGGVSIVGISSFHDDKKGEERGKNTIYSIELDGLTIAHLGDLGHSLSEDKIKELTDVDVLMIPVGGEFTIDSKAAVEIVKQINPTIVIPMHYQTPGLNPETFSKLASPDAFLAEVGLKVEKLPKLSIKAGDLVVEDQKVVLLEKR
ncbi:MAG TPA: MBL fold metallo-hydrolase [Patescibacteria group bacterium]